MSAISDFAARVTAQFEQIGAGIDGVTADVAMLKDLIEQLQNSRQALLDEMESLAANLSARIKALGDSTQPPV